MMKFSYVPWMNSARFVENPIASMIIKEAVVSNKGNYCYEFVRLVREQGYKLSCLADKIEDKGVCAEYMKHCENLIIDRLVSAEITDEKLPLYKSLAEDRTKLLNTEITLEENISLEKYRLMNTYKVEEKEINAEYVKKNNKPGKMSAFKEMVWFNECLKSETVLEGIQKYDEAIGRTMEDPELSEASICLSKARTADIKRAAVNILHSIYQNDLADAIRLKPIELTKQHLFERLKKVSIPHWRVLSKQVASANAKNYTDYDNFNLIPDKFIMNAVVAVVGKVFPLKFVGFGKGYSKYRLEMDIIFSGWEIYEANIERMRRPCLVFDCRTQPVPNTGRFDGVGRATALRTQRLDHADD